ncbi:MAG: hypothetical protein LAN59_15070 [Acidobacteriia bacterium]|nr:hypothetical protein [Terriglobia bacterium]
MFTKRNAQSPSVRRGVSDDWLRALPREKNELFDTVVRRWECTYAMMSVALDESLSLRARGELVCGRQQVGVAAELFVRLTGSLISFCDALATRGRRIHNLPAVEPLNSEFFRGDTGRSAASWNALLHRVLFGNHTAAGVLGAARHSPLRLQHLPARSRSGVQIFSARAARRTIARPRQRPGCSPETQAPAHEPAPVRRVDVVPQPARPGFRLAFHTLKTPSTLKLFIVSNSFDVEAI